MTMHLVRGMSSLNTKKRKNKRKPGWEKAQAEHDKWLMDKGCHPSQLKAKKKEFKEYVPERPQYRETKYPTISTSDTIEYVPTKKTSKCLFRRLHHWNCHYAQIKPCPSRERTISKRLS